MKVGIIGSGFVGTALKSGLKENIESIDIDPKFNTSISDLLVFSPNIVFICVPTPMSEDFDQDISILEEVINELNDKKLECLIVLKSTVLPSHLKKIKKKIPNIIYNPEFLREKHAYEDFVNSKFIIFGGDTVNAKKVAQFYKDCTICKTEDYIFTDLYAASLMKYSINSFLSTKVTFFNELNLLFNESESEESWEKFISMISKDTRIGNSHMSVPGHDGKYGFGGACLPKDSNALYKYSNQIGAELSLLKKAIDINNKIRKKYKTDTREREQNIKFT